MITNPATYNRMLLACWQQLIDSITFEAWHHWNEVLPHVDYELQIEDLDLIRIEADMYWESVAADYPYVVVVDAALA